MIPSIDLTMTWIVSILFTAWHIKKTKKTITINTQNNTTLVNAIVLYLIKFTCLTIPRIEICMSLYDLHRSRGSHFYSLLRIEFLTLTRNTTTIINTQISACPNNSIENLPSNYLCSIYLSKASFGKYLVEMIIRT